MANDEVLGPRKTMFVLVIVVGCFAVLWPKILSPMIVGHTREQLKPNQFDREAGCCEVLFESEVAVLELVKEACGSAVGPDGKLSPYAATQCRKAVNETCGVDIAAFLKRSENVGKTTKMLLETMKTSNSSCLKEHFGLSSWSYSTHPVKKTSVYDDMLKQERPIMRGIGPHPALQERGRAIPPGAPTPPSRGPVPLPPHVRVRTSPLSVYFESDNKPPPIPGMRPPLGSPGGPVTPPKSSMGLVMPIYTICIIVFFVYTLSKILFKRTGPTSYDTVAPDPQFRRRVFRDDSTPSSENKLVVKAISGLVAEVHQQMETSYAQNQQRQDAPDDTRTYTNGKILSDDSVVKIIASEYKESIEKDNPGAENDIENMNPQKENDLKESTIESKVLESQKVKESSPEPNGGISKEFLVELNERKIDSEEKSLESKKQILESKESLPEEQKLTLGPIESTPDFKLSGELNSCNFAFNEINSIELEDSKIQSKDIVSKREAADESNKPVMKENEVESKSVFVSKVDNYNNEEINNIGEESEDATVVEATKDFLDELIQDNTKDNGVQLKSTSELLEEALKEDSPLKNEIDEMEEEEDHELENSSVKHEAEDVKSIFLETEIPQQSRVLVAEFAEDTPRDPSPARNSPLVVSGKMTLSLIQDTPRDTPERDAVSTFDEFTTASALTQSLAEKEDSSEEEVEEEIEIEEIEEEVEDEEEELKPDLKNKDE